MKIFISHSSKSIKGKEALRHFCKGLRDAGHELLIDYDIYAGDDWKDEILNAIYSCDVAIVLLTQAAVGTSSWVSHECMLLMQRVRDGDPVEIIPVLIGVDRDVMAKGKFEPTGISVLNPIFDEDLTSQFTKCLAKINLVKPVNDRQLLECEADIIELLEHVSRGALDKIISELDIPTAERTGLSTTGRARLLARQLIDKNLAILDIFLSKMTRLNDLKLQVQSLLDLIRPLWVDPKASAELRTHILSSSPPTRRPVGIHTKHRGFVRHHVHRAMMPEILDYPILPIDNVLGEDTTDGILKQMRDEAQRIDNCAIQDGNAGDYDLDDYDLNQTTTYIVTGMEFISKTTLDAILAKYPNNIVIILGGKPQFRKDWPAKDVKVLEPELTEEREKAVLDAIGKCGTFLNKK